MSFHNLKHAQRERLIFLDQCLTWRGKANRRDLIDRFGVSPAQAALDFKEYLAEAGDHAPNYDPVRKVYVARPNHTPVAPETALGDWSSVITQSGFDRYCELPSLARRTDPEILAKLSRAMEADEAIEIGYTSMTTGEQPPQWIAPTCFASDGSRVHVRAYSYKHKEYRDYLPSRIDPESSFSLRPTEGSLPIDQDWHTIARITLAPRPSLTAEQSVAVRREYAFEDDILIVETRKALEFYADRRWGLDQPNARLERIKTQYIKPDASE